MSNPTTAASESTVKKGVWLSAAWLWVPSLYFAEGVPNEVVMALAGDMYALLGIDNQTMAFYTSLLYLPWVIKPLWSPLVDVVGSQRTWIVGAQLALACGFLGVALTVTTSWFFFATLACFWLIAISSATHDIAADGFYMAGLSEERQAWFLGIRSTFYRGAKFFVSGVLLAMAGGLAYRLPPAQAWAWTFALAAAVYVAMAIYHAFALPKVEQAAKPRVTFGGLGRELSATVISFFQKDRIGLALAFLLLYRFSEAQLGKIARAFMFADRVQGGLALQPEEVAVIYGTFGLVMLTIGGILGGIVIAKQGFRAWLIPMAIAINLPNLCYLGLSWFQPSASWLIGLAVSIEQLGYGFGFAAYLMYMLKISRGMHETAHYALCTGFMALGLMGPGMISGVISDAFGYNGFFFYIVLATIPSFVVTWLVFVDEKKHEVAA
ncbi:MAG: MFS transporter [Planctomycetota bacterium]